MYSLTRPFIWLSRIHHSCGFGVQSPTDYSFVRYVINEHAPYYQYERLGKDDDKLTRKLGRLYLRIANWRQPKTIMSDDYRDYLKAGCQTAQFSADAAPIDLLRINLDTDSIEDIYNKVNDESVMIVEGIRNHPDKWSTLINDERVRISYDLYYCGIVLFDKKRFKKHYIINF